MVFPFAIDFEVLFSYPFIASRRVAEKLNLRNEGVAEKYLEINGAWEDHIRFAITSEEWKERGDSLQVDWIF